MNYFLEILLKLRSTNRSYVPFVVEVELKVTNILKTALLVEDLGYK